MTQIGELLFAGSYTENGQLAQIHRDLQTHFFWVKHFVFVWHYICLFRTYYFQHTFLNPSKLAKCHCRQILKSVALLKMIIRCLLLGKYIQEVDYTAHRILLKLSSYVKYFEFWLNVHFTFMNIERKAKYTIIISNLNRFTPFLRKCVLFITLVPTKNVASPPRTRCP